MYPNQKSTWCIPPTPQVCWKWQPGLPTALFRLQVSVNSMITHFLRVWGNNFFAQSIFKPTFRIFQIFIKRMINRVGHISCVPGTQEIGPTVPKSSSNLYAGKRFNLKQFLKQTGRSHHIEVVWISFHSGNQLHGLLVICRSYSRIRFVGLFEDATAVAVLEWCPWLL